jgi:hypothetical protein
MEFASFLVFESEHLNLSLARKSFDPARFSSTLGSASSALEIAKPSEDLQLIRQIESDLVSNIGFGKVVNLQVWHYFFGIWVVEFRVDVAPTVVTRATILEWDNQTDYLQDLVAVHLELNLHEKVRPKWSTSLFLGQTGDSLNADVMNILPKVTRTVKASPSGFITSGLCGIGISCLEFDSAQVIPVTNSSIDEMKSRIMETERDAVAFCAGVYRFHDRLLKEYTDLLAGTKKMKLSQSAMEFRYFESMRTNHDLHLGPNERTINDGLWEVWDMEKLTASVEASAGRLEKEMANRKGKVMGQMQIAVALQSAVIAALVAVRPIERTLKMEENFTSDVIVAAGIAAVMTSVLLVWRLVSVRKTGA